MEQLKNEAELIGSKMVACDAQCKDINSNRASGVLPRCLFFETRGGTFGAVVVGLNPGISSKQERNFYCQHGATYNSTNEFWIQHLKNTNRYYCRTRRLVDALGLDGPLWWTELAKCESMPDVRFLSVQTLRYCGGRFLHWELRVVPKSWPVVAVGREAFKALAYLLPDRTVLGCPHPTGSRGYFDRLFDNGALSQEVNELARECLAAPMPVAKWLTV